MILSKFCKIKWHNSNQRHYMNKGYVFTKYGDEFDVKFEDLKKGCNVQITVQCDMCGQIREITLHSMNRRGYKGETCKSCSVKLFNKVKLEQGRKKSLYDWCVENSRQDLLDRWDYELNGLTPKQVEYCKRKEYYFRCDNKHESELWSVISITKNNHGANCRKCNSFGGWCEVHRPDILQRIDYDLTKKDIYTIPHASKTEIYLMCPQNEHESYKVKVNNITFRADHEFKCEKCNSFAYWGITNASKTFLEDYWCYERNTQDPWKMGYKSNKKVWIKCQDNPEHVNCIMASEIVRGERCPICSKTKNESIFQEKIRLYLSDVLGYSVFHEYDCPLKCINPKTGRQLRYDNYIPELNLYIETMGEQHFSPYCFTINKSKEEKQKEFEYLQWRDNLKREFVLKNGMNYFSVPYILERSDKYKQYIDDKINEIISKHTIVDHEEELAIA